MSQASRDSLAELLKNLESTLSAGGVELAKELFAALNTVDSHGALRRALTDPTADAQQRQALVDKVFGAQVSSHAVTVLQHLAAARWSEERDFGDGLEKVATQAVAISAEQQGLKGLQDLTDQLLGFTHVVEDSHDVQRALTDAQAPVQARVNLAEKLIGASASQQARVMIGQAVGHPRGLRPADLVRRFAEQVADRQSRWIADVTVARPLQQTQQDRLAQGLSAAFGRKLTLNVEVDPQLVGGIRIQVGDEVMDSSVASRLNDLKTQMAG